MIRSTLQRLRRGRARLVLPVVVSGLAGSLAIALSMGASLSGFTASISNPTNTAATGTMVVTETNGTTTCSSADSTSTCSSINLYGGTTTPLLPGVSQTTVVTFLGTGTLNISGGSLTPTGTPDTCTASSTGGTGSTTPSTPNTSANNLCSQINVKVYEGTVLGTKIYDGTAAGFTSPVSFAGFTAGVAQVFTFVVTLPAGSTGNVQGQRISQPLSWTFNA